MNVAVIDTTPLSITPFFKVVQVENVHKSERAGHKVLETKEMVEVRIAGDKNYAPCFPTDSQWKREGNRTITYAERWSEQYQAFKEGDPQEAMGTPLEMLRPYGATPEQVSVCKALKIYSIEALAGLEAHRRKSLGMASNSLIEMAQKFLGERMSGAAAVGEIEALKARIAELESKSTDVPEEQPSPEEIDALVAEQDAKIEAMSDGEIKDAIALLNDGKRPQGNPSRPTLISALKELQAA